MRDSSAQTKAPSNLRSIKRAATCYNETHLPPVIAATEVRGGGGGAHRSLLFADKACVENRPASGIPGANY